MLQPQYPDVRWIVSYIYDDKDKEYVSFMYGYRIKKACWGQGCKEAIKIKKHSYRKRNKSTPIIHKINFAQN